MNSSVRNIIQVTTSIVVFFVAAVDVHAALITNGGFDDVVNFTGWTLTGDIGNIGASTGPDGGNFPTSASYQAIIWPNAGLSAGISQAITTTVGQQYDFSFDYAYLGNTGSYQFTAAFGAQSALTFTDPSSSLSYTHFDQVFTATATTTNVAFSFTGPVAWLLDSVNVTEAGGGVSAVPEPTSMALMGLGLLGFAVRIGRQKMRRIPINDER